MNKYTVKLMKKASCDLEQLYNYIMGEFKEIDTAEQIVDLIEDAILSLSEFPYRGAIRKVGIFANKGYRQLFIKNYVIVYRIEEKNMIVIIVTVKNILRHF